MRRLDAYCVSTPGSVEAQLVGESQLFERVHVHVAFSLARPRAGDGEFAKDAELHLRASGGGGMAAGQRVSLSTLGVGSVTPRFGR